MPDLDTVYSYGSWSGSKIRSINKDPTQINHGSALYSTRLHSWIPIPIDLNRSIDVPWMKNHTDHMYPMAGYWYNPPDNNQQLGPFLELIPMARLGWLGKCRVRRVRRVQWAFKPWVIPIGFRFHSQLPTALELRRNPWITSQLSTEISHQPKFNVCGSLPTRCQKPWIVLYKWGLLQGISNL